MAFLVSELITEAFEHLGVIQPGETISSDMQAYAFLVLKQMYSGWSAEQVMAYLIYHQDFTLSAGVDKYTVGTGGSLVSTARPVRITSWQSSSGNFSNSGVVMGFNEFRQKTLNATAKRSVLAEMVAADFNYPSINIEVFPVPDTSPGTLALDYYSPLIEFASTATDIAALPDGFHQALAYNLAVALAPQYARVGGITPELAANAQNAKAMIVQKNAEILGLTQAPQQAA